MHYKRIICESCIAQNPAGYFYYSYWWIMHNIRLLYKFNLWSTDRILNIQYVKSTCSKGKRRRSSPIQLSLKPSLQYLAQLKQKQKLLFMALLPPFPQCRWSFEGRIADGKATLRFVRFAPDQQVIHCRAVESGVAQAAPLFLRNLTVHSGESAIWDKRL